MKFNVSNFASGLQGFFYYLRSIHKESINEGGHKNSGIYKIRS